MSHIKKLTDAIARVRPKAKAFDPNAHIEAQQVAFKTATAVEAKASKDKKEPKAKRFAFKIKLTLSGFLTLTVLTAVILPSAMAGFYAFQAQYRKALKDTWAIIFLEGENTGQRIAETLRRFDRDLDAGDGSGTKTPDFVFAVEKDQTTRALYGRGSLKTFTAKDLGLKSLIFKAPRNVIVTGGKTYLVKPADRKEVMALVHKEVPTGVYLVGWRMDFRKLMPDPALKTVSETTTYVSTTGGQLIYTNVPDLSALTLNDRPLVQKFIATNLSIGEIEFAGASGAGYYGFYYEVPGTNLTLFIETAKAQALRAMTEFAKKYALVMFFVTLGIGLILQFPLRRVTVPINELVYLSKEVARGNFAVKATSKGFGEVQALSSSFSTMAANLVQRENSIRNLMLEQQEKVRMERELSVAKSVQDNLLPNDPLPDASGLVLAAAYVPAAQVAGDWFTYDYNAATGETIVVIVDVSGHDMAASMFTAIIAGLFFEVRESHPERFPVIDFAMKAGRRIEGFGRGQWHATMQIARYVRGESKIELTNCGHTFPMVFSVTKVTERQSKVFRMPSTPVGQGRVFEGITKDVPFHVGDTLLMYTDGVTETREVGGRIYGQKRLFKIGSANAGRSVKQLVQLIHRDCLKFRGTLPTQDDLCLVALRIKDVDA